MPYLIVLKGYRIFNEIPVMRLPSIEPNKRSLNELPTFKVEIRIQSIFCIFSEQS